jgi:hypothetical protein
VPSAQTAMSQTPQGIRVSETAGAGVVAVATAGSDPDGAASVAGACRTV